MYNQTNEFVYLGGTSTTMPTCLSKWTGAYATHGADSESIPSKCTTNRALPSAQNPDANTRGTRDNAVRLRHVEPASLPQRHTAPSPPQVRLAALVVESKIAPITRLPICTRLSRREVRASRRLYAGSGFCYRDLWPAWRIRD